METKDFQEGEKKKWTFVLLSCVPPRSDLQVEVGDDLNAFYMGIKNKRSGWVRGMRKQNPCSGN